MSFIAIQSYFLAPTILNKYQLKKQDFTLMAAIKLADESGCGISRNKLRRFCETHHHITDYRNFKRVLEPLITSGYILDLKKRLYLSNTGLIRICQIERQLKKVVVLN